MATPASKILVPTRDSEEKRAREEEAAHQRMDENGRSILTMWIIGHMIQRHHSDFQIGKKCYSIIAVFSKLTNLSESGIQFDEADLEFLGNFEEEYKLKYLRNNVQFQEGTNCRELWKTFLEVLWTSDRFMRFEAKFFAKIVLYRFQKPPPDGAVMQISDNLHFLDNLTKFLKHLSMRPTLTQQMSSFYASSGLTEREKTQLLFSKKNADHFKHQLKCKELKLTDCERKFKVEQEKNKFLQAMLDREQDQMHQMIERTETMQHEIEALNLAIQRAGNVKIATCPVCMTLDNGRCGMKLTPCCGQPFCESCFETTKRTQGRQNPNCPNCRHPIQNGLVRITDSHPWFLRVEPRKMVKMVCVETMVDPADFLEAEIGGPAIDPIPKPAQKLSIYAQLLGSVKEKPCAGGGGAAMPKPR